MVIISFSFGMPRQTKPAGWIRIKIRGPGSSEYEVHPVDRHGKLTSFERQFEPRRGLFRASLGETPRRPRRSSGLEPFCRPPVPPPVPVLPLNPPSEVPVLTTPTGQNPDIIPEIQVEDSTWDQQLDPESFLFDPTNCWDHVSN
jgi:hypothetical protein